MNVIVSFQLKKGKKAEEDDFSEWEEEDENEEDKAKYWFTRDKMDKILKYMTI